MSFDDDLIEYGFSDANDYIEYLDNEAEKMYEKMRLQEQNYLSEEEMACIDEERKIKRQQAEERREKYEAKRLAKEFILKQWILENPDKAKIWFAYFSHSSEINSSKLDLFTSILATKTEYATDNTGNIFQSKYTENYYSQWHDPYYKYLDCVYFNWKKWVEKHEEFQEFKVKAKNNWLGIVWGVNASCISDTLEKYIIDYKNTKCVRFKIYKAHEIIRSWINDNNILWRDILLNYTNDQVKDDDYQFYAWNDYFYNHDTFEVWKYHNPELWEDFKSWDSSTIWEKSIERKIPTDHDTLFRIFTERNKEYWEAWLNRNNNLWQEFYELHKKLLWYVYTDSKWYEYLDKNNNTHDIQEDELNKSLEVENDDNYHELGEDDYCIDFEEYNYEIDDLFPSIPNDPRTKLLYSEVSGDIERHKVLVSQYNKEISENDEKRCYIETHCSEDNMNSFFSEYDTHEESPNSYAERKIKEYWESTHKKQWNEWKQSFLWEQYYGKHIPYDKYHKRDYFHAWRFNHEQLWDSWLNNHLTEYKTLVNDVFIFYQWLTDKNNAEIFEKWAVKNFAGWEDSRKNNDYRYLEKGYKHLFDLYGISKYGDFERWINDKPDEWDYWKQHIQEQVYLMEYEDYVYERPYEPEYKLELNIFELRALKEYGIEVFHNDLARVTNGKKYGYINKEWKIIIKPQYDYAEEFILDMACVKNGHKYGLINKNGEYVIAPKYCGLMLASKDFIFFSVEEEITNSKSQRYIIAKWGIMDGNFNVITSPKYRNIRLLQNGLITASITNKYSDEIWGLIDKNGKEISSFKYSYIYDSSNRYMLANICAEYNEHFKAFCNGEWGYLDINGSEIRPFIYAEDIASFFSLKDYEVE